MNEVRVNVAQLVSKVTENRLKHESEYKEAMIIFRREAIEKMKANLNEAMEGGDIELNVQMVRPFNHLKDYDRVLAMLEMCQDQSVTIEEEDFSAYVLDQWAWKGNFSATNASYTKRK